MQYTKLTTYQFERGNGFTEESVLAFRVLALTAVDELMRSGQATTATFPLSNDELHLILEHRVASQPRLTPPPIVVEAPAAPGPDLPQEVSLPHADDVHETAQSRPEPPISLIPAIAAAHLASDPAHAGPPDDDLAAAARWLALAMRDDSEPYRPTLGRRRTS
jgi:hypothetical protein